MKILNVRIWGKQLFQRVYGYGSPIIAAWPLWLVPMLCYVLSVSGVNQLVLGWVALTMITFTVLAMCADIDRDHFQALGQQTVIVGLLILLDKVWLGSGTADVLFRHLSSFDVSYDQWRSPMLLMAEVFLFFYSMALIKARFNNRWIFDDDRIDQYRFLSRADHSQFINHKVAKDYPCILKMVLLGMGDLHITYANGAPWKVIKNVPFVHLVEKSLMRHLEALATRQAGVPGATLSPMPMPPAAAASL